MSYFDDYEFERFYEEEKQIQRIERILIMNELTNITTGEVRLSYVHLFKPYAAMAGQEEKYSCTVLVPKTDTATMGRMNAAIEAAKQRGINEKWNGQCPPIVPTPVYDGDGVRPSDGMTFGPECKGHWVFTASAKTDYPPEIVDKMVNPIMNQSEVYSGMYGRVNVTFFPYAFGGKKGIGCSLKSVQKLRDGEPLGGSAPSAAQAFGAPQPATPQYGAVMPATPGAAGYTPVAAPAATPWSPVSQPQAPAGVNPITGMPY